MESPRLKKENIINDIRNLFRIVNNFRSNNYIEYKSKSDRKTLPAEEYPNKIKPYLKYIINDLKKSDKWKIQLIITINFISSKDDNDEEPEMH